MSTALLIIGTLAALAIGISIYSAVNDLAAALNRIAAILERDERRRTVEAPDTPPAEWCGE